MDSIAQKFPYLVRKKLKEGEEIRRVAQLDWRIIESDLHKPFTTSGLEFVPLPVIHGEDYVSLGFLFGRKSKVAYISDVSRFPPSTEHDYDIVEDPEFYPEVPPSPFADQGKSSTTSVETVDHY
ncbi:hypothetical protein GUJ93_ZPchr0012g20086 [Zizania palustris]|uniref:Uncharacterized protein n=1 Tax=Zizania palustris TaxID=103762 RepID=A0A8J5WQM5_ZIZPA|nr:hypothetical protein GUJ93_ZPchr0012g20086 [Zizania palustris]